MSLTVISDVHGKFDEYLKIAQNCEASFQLGDFGFADTWNKLHYSGLSPDDHQVLAGNHDPYDFAPKSPFYTGNYGMMHLGGVEFFYIRGGLSIDRLYREVNRLNGSGRSYWTQEELSFAQMLDCVDLYRSCKPDIVVSHVPPALFIPELTSSDKMLTDFGFHEGFRENTALLGDALLDIHIPKLWTSGHMHRSLTSHTLNGMKFVSLAELESYTID